MCMMVWVGTERPLPEVTAPQEGHPALGWYHVTPVADDAAIRARFTTPHVAYVGSHEGCGCGYASTDLTCQGYERLDEVGELIDALADDERTRFLAELASRRRLADLVRRAATDGPVEVFGCWAGDEAEPPLSTTTVSPDWFEEQLAPVAEGGLYRVEGA